MIKKFGLTLGGLQQKILNLVLIFILLIIGLYVAVSMFLSKNLSGIVEQSAQEQKASITQVSEDTMSGVLGVTMTKSARMQAYMEDNLFAEAQGNVLTLQEQAEYLFSHRSEFEDKAVYAPKRSNDGKPSVQLQHEAAVDPADDPDLGLAANMGELMLSLFRNSDVLNSCFIATVNGDILFVDDRAGAYFDADGNVEDTFEVRQRPWYTGAVQTVGLYFTGIELDAFTDIPGLVCSAPVYVNGKLVAVVGADIFLTNIAEYVNNSTQNGSFVCIINEDSEVIFSPQSEGTFQAVTADQTVSLKDSGNAALADFAVRALTANTELETLTVDGKDYYLCGAPMETVGWTVISVIDKELSDQPTKAMLANYDAINAQALTDYQAGAAHSQRVILLWTAVLLALASVGALTVAGRIVKPVERMTKRIPFRWTISVSDRGNERL